MMFPGLRSLWTMPCSCKCFIPATNLKMHDSFVKLIQRLEVTFLWGHCVPFPPLPFCLSLYHWSTFNPLPPPITSSVKSLHRLLKRQKHLIKTFIACRPKCACCVLSRQQFFCFWPLLRVQIAHIVLQTLSHTHPHGWKNFISNKFINNNFL